MLKSVLFPLCFYLCVAAVATKKQGAKLARVVVLSRHGNRAPNLQVQDLCPTFANEVYPKFLLPWAALSRVGMAENWESGVYLKNKYIGSFLEKGPFIPTTPPKVSFFSERMSRNIVSTYALAQGMYPEGTGLDGYLKSKPNLIPIATTQENVDELMNCPRDGPCRKNYKIDFNIWAQANQEQIFEENRELFERVSTVCGFTITPTMTWRGKNKTLPWAVKAISDAFSFSANEGLDPTMEGKLSAEDIAAVKNLSNHMITGTRFSQPHQMTYWVSNFLPNLFKLAKRDPKDETFDVHKFHLFLNHRELMLAIATILKIPIPFSGGALVPGCMITFEVWEQHGETFLKFYWWGPSTPTAAAKTVAYEKSGNLESIYTGGKEYPVAPEGCESGHLCPLSQVEKLFNDYIAKTGDYKHVCNQHEWQSMKPNKSVMNVDAEATGSAVAAATANADAPAAVRSDAAIVGATDTTGEVGEQHKGSSSGRWFVTSVILGVVCFGLWKYANKSKWSDYASIN